MNKHHADSNFIVYSADRQNYEFHNYREFLLEGFPFYEMNQNFVRIPMELLGQFSDNMQEICRTSAGGVLRFHTNSKKLAIIASYSEKHESSTMTQMGDAGFDLYRWNGSGWEFMFNYYPQIGAMFLNMERTISNSEESFEYMLYFPVFSWVQDLEIGVLKNQRIEKTSFKLNRKKALFYGSSITYGACATRPGTTYPAMLCRMLDYEMLNLGFAGNCMGETVMAELLASLDFDIFIYEYGYNALTQEHLVATHEPFFEIIRKAHPDVPVVFVTAPVFNPPHMSRMNWYHAVVTQTYRNAVESGDKNVYLFDGRKVFPDSIRTDCTADNTHPNDLGFRLISDELYRIVAPILTK